MHTKKVIVNTVHFVMLIKYSTFCDANKIKVLTYIGNGTFQIYYGAMFYA